MTIALAIVSDSVLLVAADSQESYGWSDKRAKSKLGIGHPKSSDGRMGTIVVTGAGDSGFIEYLQGRIIDGVRQLRVAEDEFASQAERVIHEEISDFYKTHFSMLTFPPEVEPSMIIGLRIGAKAYAWKTHHSTVSRITGYHAVGSGEPHAMRDIRRKMKLFAFDEQAAAQVACYAIFQAKSNDSGCGLETQMVVCLREHPLIEASDPVAVRAAEDIFRKYDALQLEFFDVIAAPRRSAPIHTDERLAAIRGELAAIRFFPSRPPPETDPQ